MTIVSKIESPFMAGTLLQTQRNALGWREGAQMIHDPMAYERIAYIAFDLHVTLQRCVPLLMAVVSIREGASVGSSSQADCLLRNVAMDDSIGGS